MKLFLSTLALFLLMICSIPLFAGDYDKAWDALLKNDQRKALELFRKAVKSNDNKDNALSMLIVLESYLGKQTFDKDFDPLGKLSNPDPYLYALWFQDAFLGEYGKKQGAQLSNLDRIINDPHYKGSLKAAANYFKGLHYMMSQNFEKGAERFKNMGALESWQFVGPFDNVCGSGFNKEYGPLTQPFSKTGFLSSNNTMVNWFSPLYFTNEGWVFVAPFYTSSNAIGYAQCFVNSPNEQDAILCLGGYGSFKTWINDKLLLTEQEEKRTELDAYQVKCHLNKGYNRVLVQIGYTAQISAPNFIIRLTDTSFNGLTNITASELPQAYAKDTSAAVAKHITHFAEDYFLQRMAKTPQDFALPFLLSKVYIRNQEYDKAKAVMHDLYKKYPENPFIINYYAQCLSPMFENTQIAELVEKVKLLDADNYWVLSIEEEKLEEEKKYDEALVLVDKLIAKNGRTLTTDLKRIGLSARLAKVDSAIAMIKDLYAREKDNWSVANIMALYYKDMAKEPNAVLGVLEEFVKGNYNYNMNAMLANEYFERNETAKGLDVLRRSIAFSPYEPDAYQPLVEHFFSKQQYDSAIYYLDKMSGISPYNHRPLGDIASCYMQKNDTEKALVNYRKALSFYAGGFDYRMRIRELEKKQNLFKYFPQTDYYASINQAFKKPFDTAHSYYYVLEERNVVIYSEGASEQVYSMGVLINNKDGIDTWKELSIPYNNYYQTVQILKAEVLKPNGSRVPAETEGNQIVFAKLEPGDAIYYSYKIGNYGTGRLGKEFWDKFYFNSSVPAKELRYNVMVAEDLPFYYEMMNDNSFKPVEGRKENFRTYSWMMKDVPAIRSETYMPNLEDIGKVLHISTVKSWDVIAEWYSDLTRMQSREDFELNEAFKNIFPKGTSGLTDMEKASKIYEFIEQNIAYSSVSFRQSEYVPQRAGKTLQTRLGDCKDVSTLFLAFARKALLDANLMLVSTRNNGLHSVVLPSMDFNHCIIRFKAGNDYHYLELTDNRLPFNALTRSLTQAQVLNIPYYYSAGEVIHSLPVNNRDRVSYIRKVQMVVNKNDLQVSTSLRNNGNLASDMRANFENKTKDERKDELQRQLGQLFKNQVLLNNFDFKYLNNLSDTVVQELDFVVKNDVISMGDLNMLKPAFIEMVATVDIFSNEKRKYPFEYSNYELADIYNTVIEIQLPAGKTFDQVPSDVKSSFMNMQYQLTYRKTAPDKLVVERIFNTDRAQQLQPADFERMEPFFNQIIAAEQKYISFK